MLQGMLVADMHCDTLLCVADGQRRLLDRSPLGHLDLPRMLEGGYRAVVCAVYIEPCYLPGGAISRALKVIDRLHAEALASAGRLAVATTSADVLAANAAGAVACILGLEGAEPLEGDLALLRVFHRLGVRLVTLAWSRRNLAGDGVGDPRTTTAGLTSFGVSLVREMDRLGIMVDVSHLNEAGFWDALEVGANPVVASHSNAFGLCPHPRNLTDEQLRAVAAKRGVVGVTLCPPFLKSEGTPTIEDVAEHVLHIAAVAGIEYVGLGSDYDGFTAPPPAGLEDASRIWSLCEALAKRGLSEADIRKVMGDNFLRVFAQVCG